MVMLMMITEVVVVVGMWGRKAEGSADKIKCLYNLQLIDKYWKQVGHSSRKPTALMLMPCYKEEQPSIVWPLGSCES